MKAVQEHIALQQKHFAAHPFFTMLERGEPLHVMLPFASGLAFWAMVFQDVIRLNDECVEEPVLRTIVHHHRVEDRGHDKWFLGDLRKLGIDFVNVEWIFSPEHQTTRDASYALMAEAFRAPNDACRVVLLLTLESFGNVFFDRIVDYMESQTGPSDLEYFARHHLDVEKGHELLEKRINQLIAGIHLSDEDRASAIALVDRASAAFNAMFDGICAVISAGKQRQVKESGISIRRMKSGRPQRKTQVK